MPPSTFHLRPTDKNGHRWWSITLYGRDGFLVGNKLNRFSFNSRNVPRALGGPSGAFSFRISPRIPSDAERIASGGSAAADLLPSGGGAGKIFLTLRLYHPDDWTLRRGGLERIRLPSIRKVKVESEGEGQVTSRL